MSNSQIFALAQSGDANGLLYHIQREMESINEQDMFGNTPLICAAWNGHMPCVLILVNVAVKLNTQNKWGWTALHLAAEAGRLDIVHVLIEAGANPYIRTEDGHTIVDVAKNDSIREFLKSGKS